jgi:hypothetical protein
MTAGQSAFGAAGALCPCPEICYSAPKICSWQPGVRPRSWTGSRGGFDPLPGVVILELRGAQVAERGTSPALDVKQDLASIRMAQGGLTRAAIMRLKRADVTLRALRMAGQDSQSPPAPIRCHCPLVTRTAILSSSSLVVAPSLGLHPICWANPIESLLL